MKLWHVVGWVWTASGFLVAVGFSAIRRRQERHARQKMIDDLVRAMRLATSPGDVIVVDARVSDSMRRLVRKWGDEHNVNILLRNDARSS